MKKFTKFMLSVAAVSAVSAAMAISAMAADTVTGTYASDTGVVTLEGVVSSGDQQTLLVLTEDAATVTDTIIAQIDQDAEISQFVLPAELTEGTYYIRIGGTNGTIQTGTLTIGGEPGGGDEPVKLLVGDANSDDFVDAEDAVSVLRHDAGLITLTGDELLKAAYCDGDYFADAEDAVRILRFDAGADGGNAGKEMEIPAEG